MNATKRVRPIAMILLLAVLAGCLFPTGVDLVYGAEPVSKEQAQAVGTFAELKAAVEAGRAVRLTADITANSDIGAKQVDADITIYGEGYTLNMATYQFQLTGSHNLYVSDLTIQTDSKNTNQRYGVFCISAGSATSSKYVWEAAFHNLTFKGSALLGTKNSDDHTSTTRMFQSATFTGDTNILITNAYAAHIGVVCARNIGINGTFVMKDEISGANAGVTNPTYQYYFKSPGTGGGSIEADNTVARGMFYVAADADVTLNRSPGQGSTAQTSSYYRSLIFGYADHYFGEGASFTAKAGTNLYGSSGLSSRSAVIRSNDASSFVVDKGAEVRLETDLVNYSSSAEKSGSYGFTALSLKKSGALELLVEEGATLDIYADGRNTSPSYGTRAQAPVVIWGSGSSATTVKGNLKVYSENGNGWYYAYSALAAGKARFIVEGTGNVDIRANNLGVKGADEYAAFEAYGKYDVDIIVRDGGKMTVMGNGYRGMSLAGAGGYNNKNILVSGAGSELDLSGVHWAIAAETQPILNITAKDGGKISLASTGDVDDGYSKAGSAPSTVYSVGPTTYTVDGADSQIKLHHNGGMYSAIFHDGYGPLKIHVTDGGNMDVYNRNTGTGNAARRAAITAQSTKVGSHGSYDNEIIIRGEGSTLTVFNENPNTHSDTGLYPTGAISFNKTATGNILVADGGSLYATSSSLAPTIHLFEGKITLDNPGDFDIRNNTLDNEPKSSVYALKGQAIYNEKKSSGKTYATALEVIESDISVWSRLEGKVDFADSYMDNRWEQVSFAANNKAITVLDAAGLGGDTNLALNQFDLSAYGRISGSGKPSSSPVTITYEANSGIGGPFVEARRLGDSYTIVNDEVTGIVKDDFELSGWNTKADGSGDAYEPGDVIELTADLTLYAQWRYREDSRLMVTYRGGTGNGSAVSPGLIPGQSYTVFTQAEAGVDKSYHLFTGWNTQEDGSGTYYAPGEVIPSLTDNLTLYAQWEYDGDQYFTVIYDGLGLVPVYREELLVYGQEYTLKSAEEAGMTYPGLIIASWQGEDGTVYEIGETIIITESVLLFANWTVAP